MTLKWIGALLIFASCGGFALKLFSSYRKEETTLRQLIRVLDYMTCELQYHMTPLPMLCRQTAKETSGILSDIFLKLAMELEQQILPDAECCMSAVLSNSTGVPSRTQQMLEYLGQSLGKFGLNGQLLGMEAVRQRCRESLQEFKKHSDTHLRGYQTIALCAGAALTILFI